MKRRNKKEVLEFAKKLYEENRNNGTTVIELAKRYNIDKAYAHRLIEKHKLVMFRTDKDECKVFEDKLVDFLESEKPSQKKNDYIVLAGDIADKNYLVVSVIEPELNDPDGYNKELKRRIKAELKFIPALEGFKLFDEKINE